MDNEFTIVYKTYKQDLGWLRYSLLTLKKFVTGFKEIIIYCHDICCGELYQLVNEIKINCRIIPVSYDYHGYLKQMVVKTMCYNDVSTKYIAIVDSDNIFNKSLNLYDLLMDDGRIPWHYKSPVPASHEICVWKESYENMTKTKQDRYYMQNGFPFIFTAESMRLANNKFIEIHGIDYATFCKNGCQKFNIQVEDSICKRFLDLAKIFEEFEWLGFYCQTYSDDYIFINSIDKSKPSQLLQFWSYGGITPEIKSTIDKLCN